MRKLLLTYGIILTLCFFAGANAFASGNGKSNQAKIAAMYSKKIMTGGLIGQGQSTKSDSAFSAYRRGAVDTAKNNRILGIRENSGGMYQLEIDLAENQQNLSIGVYNLLGKKVIDVNQGTEYAGKSKMFDLNVQGIPNGIYMCIVQGDNFRLAEKFYISR